MSTFRDRLIVDLALTTDARVAAARGDHEILQAIKTVREQAAEERAARHKAGEPLTDYDSGVLDGLDAAWIAGIKAARRPEDNRETTSLEEWWACEDAYRAGFKAAIEARALITELDSENDAETAQEVASWIRAGMYPFTGEADS